MISDKTKGEFRERFGQQLETLRKEKKLTYRKIAQNCDLDYSYISKIAKGEVNVTLDTILEVLKGLDTTPQELFNFEFLLKESDKK